MNKTGSSLFANETCKKIQYLKNKKKIGIGKSHGLQLYFLYGDILLQMEGYYFLMYLIAE